MTPWPDARPRRALPSPRRIPLTRPLTLDSVVVATERQLSYPLEDELVVLSTDEGSYYGLRGPAERIWSLLDEPREVRAIRDRLLDEFEVAPERCAEDVLRFLRDMEAKGLVQVVG